MSDLPPIDKETRPYYIGALIYAALFFGAILIPTPRPLSQVAFKDAPFQWIMMGSAILLLVMNTYFGLRKKR